MFFDKKYKNIFFFMLTPFVVGFVPCDGMESFNRISDDEGKKVEEVFERQGQNAGMIEIEEPEEIIQAEEEKDFDEMTREEKREYLRTKKERLERESRELNGQGRKFLDELSSDEEGASDEDSDDDYFQGRNVVEIPGCLDFFKSISSDVMPWAKQTVKDCVKYFSDRRCRGMVEDGYDKTKDILSNFSKWLKANGKDVVKKYVYERKKNKRDEIKAITVASFAQSQKLVVSFLQWCKAQGINVYEKTFKPEGTSGRARIAFLKKWGKKNMKAILGALIWIGWIYAIVKMYSKIDNLEVENQRLIGDYNQLELDSLMYQVTTDSWFKKIYKDFCVGMSWVVESLNSTCGRLGEFVSDSEYGKLKLD